MMSVRNALLVVVVLFVGCSGRDEKAADAVTATPGASSNGLTLVIGRAPRGALVTLEPASGNLPLPEGGALMDQYGKQFVPETLFVRVGQPVTFRNSEDQLHNVIVIRSRTGAAVFNTSQSPYEAHVHTFDRPGEFDVSCDIHPGMRATIVATTTPYVVYADGNGSFSFQNVAPGSYKLRTSADGRETERSVEVSGARLEIS